MEQFLIEGPVALEGRLRPGGSKNSTLPLMCAALLSEGVSELRSVPRLRDVNTLIRVLETLGASCDFSGDRLRIDARDIPCREAPYELVKTMRASITVLGPLLGRFGEARVSLPGGCAWGPRPVDLHLEGLRALGARIDLDHGYIDARCPDSGRLEGGEVQFRISSVGATENILMAAVLARGETRIHNAAREPDVECLARNLVAMGAKIEGIGTGTLLVRGVESLDPLDCEVPPDRIEVGTYLAAAPITRGRIRVEGCIPSEQSALLDVFRQAGLEMEVGEDFIEVDGSTRMKPVDLVTEPYPGFPTDMQAQVMAACTLADGISTLTETIYLDRFTHVAELRRLGAKIRLDGNVAVVTGVEKLQGAPVMATDLRASAALVLAACAAEGETRISRIYHIDRGYDQIEAKLQSLGARILRKEEE
ncbi:MAG: UDP-N-acetylglucosamine 1-carboxyvinyltransferase [Candidatus Krumholzibacteria bacterium]|jgi:UDP-N-acetylglucosamine 1-carboxyvinyltransferase|nr:UDP-N-acetylglucosamine 1-carboxyvinyltransferase [Candidatus Krumholzibacteria bacterium]MDP6668488.1 UDP-N-acetylglucosamine 1-carboxyvinyltransferase [Candidatus Krumholzibacteria bacterium]MDP6796592.1 UDP-N-acetylglucosamine 1-carboxyvinyltransferase [Candidatus Krumholzibacteria bacterium]MDP7021581.1 UDP-N-acetylglucosamine 1-carboxyvinyltransferase [Candidatus Krumholzibacteria bacterium]